MQNLEEFKAWSRREGYAGTAVLVGLVSLAALYHFASRGQYLRFACYPGSGIAFPPQLLTYPFAGSIATDSQLVGFVLLAMWLFSIGKLVERDFGTERFAAIWVIATLSMAMCHWIGSAIAGGTLPIMGPFLPTMALTGVWAGRNPEAKMMFYGILPLGSKAILGIGAALIILNTGIPAIPVGVMDCVPMLVGFYYGVRSAGGNMGVGVFRSRQKRATTRGQVLYDDSYFDDVRRREREREEQERLRKLLGE